MNVTQSNETEQCLPECATYNAFLHAHVEFYTSSFLFHNLDMTFSPYGTSYTNGTCEMLMDLCLPSFHNEK